MHLLKLETDSEFRPVEFLGADIPHYAILSHTWGPSGEEVNYRDIMEGTGKKKIGYRKLQFCREQAAADGLQYIWVDTCCIDKSSSAELSEAINSMFRWYSESNRCYVYLTDVSVSINSTTNTDLPNRHIWEPTLRKSRWFTRGWTLQELLAPMSVEFFSVEGRRLGDKRSLRRLIREVTGIALEALQGYQLSYFSVDDRISWGSNRKTTREEDAAYSQLGIFDIHMPLIYGEGRRKAMARLHKEIKETINDSSNNIIGGRLGDSEENKYQQYSGGKGENSARAGRRSNAKSDRQEKTTSYAPTFQIARSAALQRLKNDNIEYTNWLFPLTTIPTVISLMAILLNKVDREALTGIQIESQDVRDFDGETLCSLPSNYYFANLQYSTEFGRLAFLDTQREMCNIRAMAWSILSEQGSMTYIIELLEDWEDARYNLKFEIESLKSTMNKCLASAHAIAEKFDKWYFIITHLLTASLDLKIGMILDSNPASAKLANSSSYLRELKQQIESLINFFVLWRDRFSDSVDQMEMFLRPIYGSIKGDPNLEEIEAIEISRQRMETIVSAAFEISGYYSYIVDISTAYITISTGYILPALNEMELLFTLADLEWETKSREFNHKCERSVTEIDNVVQNTAAKIEGNITRNINAICQRLL